ncbi:MAG: hypothetical protein AB1665_09315 [Candidatus Thermoplasmatota archaeon]
MVRTTTTTSSGGDRTPDVMEPISVDAMGIIGAARAKIIELLEMCDEHLSGTAGQPSRTGSAACARRSTACRRGSSS